MVTTKPRSGGVFLDFGAHARAFYRRLRAGARPTDDLSTVTCLALGGCPLNNPLASLVQRKLARSVLKRMGFGHTPFSLSVNGAVQLMRFIRGDLEIPRWLRDSCYADPTHVPDAAQRAILAEVDVCLVEMSTPIEFIYQGFVLNQNRLKEQLGALQACSNEASKALSKWMSEGLQKQNEDARRKYSDMIIAMISGSAIVDQRLTSLVRNLRGRHVKEAEIYAGLKTLTELVPAPMGVVLHNYSYMPDGRPVIFPADFKDNSLNAAETLGLPCYDPLVIVRRHWGGDVLMEDARHYARAFEPIIADEYLAFARLLAPRLLFQDYG